jgi:hypothetical protein
MACLPLYVIGKRISINQKIVNKCFAEDIKKMGPGPIFYM